MNIKDKMFKILKDTRDWYAEDPKGRRSLDADGNCLFTWGKNHCAVGRYLKSEYQIENWRDNNESVNELCIHSEERGEYNIDWALRDEFHGLDPDFWTHLQEFHDTRHYWNTKTESWDNETDKGLSFHGKDKYNDILSRITDGKYDE